MRESELLEHIYRSNGAMPLWVTLPPGDDMGSIRIGDHDVLITVDQLVDGIHFDSATTPAPKIARKAITRNLSDVAAMAGRPIGAVVAASLPKGLGQSRAIELFDAMQDVAHSYQCPLIGGDISIWGHALLLTVTVLATPGPLGSPGPIRRDGARVGDAICVTGELGGSEETIDGYTHHFDFEPRLEVAASLAQHPGIFLHSMIDLSDGLAKDVGNICRASAVAAELWADRLPISEAAQAASARDGVPTWQHAIGDGEDYELCFTLPQDEARATLPGQIHGVTITQVGKIIERSDGPLVCLHLPDGTRRSVDDLGWEHRD